MFELVRPEVFLIFTGLFVLVADLFMDERQKSTLGWITIAGLAIAWVACLQLPVEGTAFGGRFAIDSVSKWFKVILVLGTFVTVILSLESWNGLTSGGSVGANNARTGQGTGLPIHSRGELLAILCWVLSGMLFLISSRDLVLFYVSLELATVPLFVLAAWNRTAQGGEAGMKYVVIGALASALLLYGLGFIYGLVGSTQFDVIWGQLRPSPMFYLAAGLVIAGLGFKLTLVPFHMWAPDVYQGAPTSVTAFLSVVSKGLGLGATVWILYRLFGKFISDWAPVLAWAAAITMTLGNLVAIVQHDIKRLMAFSAVSQAGYLLMGFTGTPADGIPSLVYFLLVYAVTNLLVFGVIIVHGHQTGRDDLKSYRGLSQTHPLMALMMMVGLFGLAGIPPLSGFVGKFFLFSVSSRAGFHWLVAVAAINSTVSLYYYLRIVREMYIEPAPEGFHPVRLSPLAGLTLVILTLASILLGVAPQYYQGIQSETRAWATKFVSR